MNALLKESLVSQICDLSRFERDWFSNGSRVTWITDVHTETWCIYSSPVKWSSQTLPERVH